MSSSRFFGLKAVKLKYILTWLLLGPTETAISISSPEFFADSAEKILEFHLGK